MADDTFVARGINRVWQQGTGNRQGIFKANGADIAPGFFMTQEGETAGTRDIDLCAAGEEPAGAMLKTVEPDHGGRVRSLDDAAEDNEDVWVQEPGGDNTTYAWLIANAGTMKKGTQLMISSEAGKLIKAAVDASSDGAPTDAELTTMLNTVVATLEEDYTNDASDDWLVKVKY